MESLRSSTTGSQVLLKTPRTKERLNEATNAHEVPWYRGRAWVALLSLFTLVLVVLAVILPVYFTVIKAHKDHGANSGSGSSQGSSLKVQHALSYNMLLLIPTRIRLVEMELLSHWKTEPSSRISTSLVDSVRALNGLFMLR